MLSGYELTIEGQYYITLGDNKGAGLKRYKFKIKLPTMDCALSIIKGKILDVVLPKLYPNYTTYRTHNITNVLPFGNAVEARLNIWQMNRQTVESFIQENELPVITKLYPELMKLREAVEMAQADPDRFARVQKETEKDYKLTTALRELNPELYQLPEEDAMGQETPKTENPVEDLLATL